MPHPVVLGVAGTAVVGGVLGVAGTLRLDPWPGFVAETGEHYDPDADELPVPDLLESLGLDGLRVEGVLRGGEPDEE